MRLAPLALAALAALAACGHSDRGHQAADVIARGWDAHEAVLAAGEHAASCAEVGPAMQKALAGQHQALAEAFALERDTDQLGKIVDFLEAHQDRLDELARRGEALRAKCPDDAGVVGAFRALQPP